MMSEDFDAHERLQRLYADMSDSKLLEMAEHIDDLTDVAQRALNDEISKRGIATQHAEQETAPVLLDPGELVAIFEAKDRDEAQRVADILENAGIASVVTTEKIEYVDGVEDKPVVKVVYVERSRALAVLHEALPREEEEDAPQFAVCPTCHSPDIVLQSLDTQPGDTANTQYNWSCDACGHQWIDDGLEQLGDARAE